MIDAIPKILLLGSQPMRSAGDYACRMHQGPDSTDQSAGSRRHSKSRQPPIRIIGDFKSNFLKVCVDNARKFLRVLLMS
jgi:hypothetical protein